MSDRRDAPTITRFADDALGPLFARAEAEYRSNIDETKAWQRLQARMLVDTRMGITRRYRWMLVAAAAIAVVAWAGWRIGSPLFMPLRAAAVRPIANPPANPGVTSIRLAEGESTLFDGTTVALTDGANATYKAAANTASLEFARGRLDISVAHQEPGHTFVVKTRNYEFSVLGTKFKVGVNGARVALDVTEGRVAVSDSGRELEIVSAGGHWSNETQALEAAPAPSPRMNVADAAPRATPVAAPQPENPSDPSICRDLLRDGDATKAERCYASIAAGSGLSAEMSLYEIARLRRDVLGNGAGALAALDEYESRFSSGTLAPEVRAARIDMLARLGRVDEALAESAKLLGSANASGRAVELRLLRGNLLREKKHDCPAAIAEYRLIESDPGPRGDQAMFAHASCLRQLGQREEAVQSYQRYLKRSSPQRADAARKALAELDQ